MLTLYTDGGCNLKKDGIGAWAYLVEGNGVPCLGTGARDLSFETVKGHSGHPQNELVDELCSAEIRATFALYAEDPLLVRHDPGCPAKRAA
jgi:ribonuclease HI